VGKGLPVRGLPAPFLHARHGLPMFHPGDAIPNSLIGGCRKRGLYQSPDSFLSLKRYWPIAEGRVMWLSISEPFLPLSSRK
jgi:hypothetical protein